MSKNPRMKQAQFYTEDGILFCIVFDAVLVWDNRLLVRNGRKAMRRQVRAAYGKSVKFI